MSSIVTIYGGESPEKREPSQNTIEILEEWLRHAKSGRCIGVVVAGAFNDGSADWSLAGRIGRFSLLGALVVANATVLELEHTDGD